MGVGRAFTTADRNAAAAVCRTVERRGVPITVAAHDAAAIVMAAVTGDLTAAPGLVLLEAVPLAPRTLAALDQARSDRSPMLAITANERPARALGSVTKASLEITPESAAHWIAHAGHLAMTDPRGPVHLAIGSGISRAPAMPLATSVRPPALSPPAPDDLDAAAALITASVHPLVIAGVQARSRADAEWLRAFAETLPAPVVSTPKARGVIPEPHPLSLGVLGRHGVVAELVRLADLVIALGLDIADDRAAVPSSTAVLHVARTDLSLHAYARARQVVGDIGLILEELAPRLRDRRRADWDVAELDRFKRALARERGATDVSGGIGEVVALAREATPAGAIAVFDRGVVAAADRWTCVLPLDLVAPQSPTSDGFAVPAALAARLACPDRPVVAFTDFTGLTASLPELATASHLGLALVIVVANDTDTRIATLPETADLRTFAIDSDRSRAEIVARAVELAGPSVIDVRIEPRR